MRKAKHLKRVLLTTLAVLAMTGTAMAAPFLICDPQTGVTYYIITGLPATIDGSHINAQPDGSIKLDMALTPAGGPYNLSVKACADVWGCSSSSPFVFSRPAALTAPGGLRLAP